GLVAHRTQTGTREECTYSNGRSVCQTQPVYSTTMVPGPVEVYTTRGRLCAPNGKLVTAQTQKVSLSISIPTNRPGGFMRLGRATNDIVFVWASHKSPPPPEPPQTQP